VRRPAAAAAVLLTAAVLLAGCSSGDGQATDTTARHAGAPHSPDRGTATTAAPSADGTRHASREQGGHAGEAKPRRHRALKDTRPNGPTVPKAELTPATGSFTDEEKEYLTDRVPEGTDPAAVLAAGQETCERISRTAKVDRRAAVEAMRSGEIGGAKAAVTHLCPEHRDLLRAAEG
jgi:hypothetical protein